MLETTFTLENNSRQLDNGSCHTEGTKMFGPSDKFRLQTSIMRHYKWLKNLSNLYSLFN